MKFPKYNFEKFLPQNSSYARDRTLCVYNLVRDTKQNLINKWETNILAWTFLEKKKKEKGNGSKKSWHG